MSKYQPTIGIEIHVQLATRSKLFAAVNNDAREAAPNSLVSEICYGLPGVLPVLNEQAVELAIKAGLALKAEIAEFSKFDRKHYYYPDLPKGYQITQYDQPIVGKGSVDIRVDDTTKTIGITRAHLEEDAGKLIHPVGKDYSQVDLNRAGTPLLEIVSEPDITSAKEAKAFVKEIYLLMKFARVSDVDLYYGNMRFDVNISLAKPDAKDLGTRAEIKNLNSFKSVERAVEHEIKRQTELLDKGQKVVQETRGWDDAKQKTIAQRSKEEAHDYRYFPDPDLPPVTIDQQQIDNAKTSSGQSLASIRDRLATLGFNSSDVESFLTIDEFIPEAELDSYSTLINVINDDQQARFAANWVINSSNMEDGSNDRISYIPSPKQVKAVHKLYIDKSLSSNNAYQLLSLLKDDQDPKQVADEAGLMQMSDTSQLEKVIDKVLTNNPKAVEDISKGEQKAIGFLVGQVMKESKGKANPAVVQEIIKSKLE